MHNYADAGYMQWKANAAREKNYRANHILGYLSEKDSELEILEQYPSLEAEDIRA